MMAAVPTATVVITNPTHFAVALAYVLHQPYRCKLFPALEDIISAAVEAGAAGAALSGAGSSILAFALGGEDRVAEAMAGAGMRAGITGRAMLTKICYSGAQVTERA